MREPWNALEKRAEAGVVSSSCSVARAADGLRWIGGQTWAVLGDSWVEYIALHIPTCAISCTAPCSYSCTVVMFVSKNATRGWNTLHCTMSSLSSRMLL